MKPTIAALAFALRNVPFESGRWRLIRAGLNLCREQVVTPTIRTVKTRHRFRMRVDVSEWLGRHIYVTGEYEPATTAVIKGLLRPGDTFVDVGANAGYFSLLAADCVGRNGSVFAFEPVPHTHKLLTDNLVLNGVPRCEVSDVAVSNSDGKCEMFVGPRDHSGVSSFRKLDEAIATVQVSTAKLDTFLPDGLWVDLVKIDVEGAECHVLEGMTAILERCHPHVVAEITPNFLEAMGRSTNDVERLIKPLGYRMFAIEHAGLRPLEKLSDNRGSQFNALITIKPSLPASLRVLD